ncbi:hypothetical protein ACFQ6N_22510 [Kitasatospora sp. NPDC056446]|uniref:hypothetical protein n=1 Tax=Kitasatospora sp. NPDC056446 TaxID=3345819 RepID=UPI0036C3DD60
MLRTNLRKAAAVTALAFAALLPAVAGQTAGQTAGHSAAPETRAAVIIPANTIWE